MTETELLKARIADLEMMLRAARGTVDEWKAQRRRNERLRSALYEIAQGDDNPQKRAQDALDEDDR